jgi:predicted secreted protein
MLRHILVRWVAYDAKTTLSLLTVAIAMTPVTAKSLEEHAVIIPINGRADETIKVDQKIAEGDVVLLKFETRPGTGFGWNLDKGDQERLVLESDPTFEGAAGRPGGVELQVFRFKVKGSGEAKLDFLYRRPFEKDTPPRRVRHVKFSIKS